MKPCTNTPCKQCPFRRKSLPGYLGADTPEHFIAVAHSEAEMPCHNTVDYGQRDWEKQLYDLQSKARHCAGRAIYNANVLKLPRDPNRRRLLPDKVTVFASPKEFLDHHGKGPRWDEEKMDYVWPGETK